MVQEMEGFALEVFAPVVDSDFTVAEGARLTSLAQAIDAEGITVRYLRCLHLPADETCFYVFEAESAAAMHELVARAGLDAARLVRVDLAADDSEARAALGQRPTGQGW